MATNILLADDENIFRETFAKILQEENMEVTAVDNGLDAIAESEKTPFDVVILDIQMPGADGIKVLSDIMKNRPETPVIMITAYGTVEMAVEAIKMGACDYVIKPVIFDDILAKIRQKIQYKALEEENQTLKNELKSQSGIDNIISQSPMMTPIFNTIRKVANTRSSVLVTGESGTGKELVARAIHSLDTSPNGRFVAINCSAIPENLLESELFGHKKGSFTSANDDKQGLFEIACGGTLFLDEIAYMPMSCQVKLLRALEDRKILPVGGTEQIDIDVRIISATNKNLPEEIKHDRFREDLYYRIDVVGIHLPALRERKEDIPLLVDYFIKKYNREMGKNCRGTTEEVMHWLMSLEWKGNIRELQNVIERAIIFTEGEWIKYADIDSSGSSMITLGNNAQDLTAALRSYERAHVSRVLEKYDFDKPAAAKALGVGLSSLYRKIEELEIDVDKKDKKAQGVKN